MCNRNSRKRREDCDRKIFEETWSETYLNLVKKKKKTAYRFKAFRQSQAGYKENHT